MKKVFNWMLMAAMVCGLSLSFTACSDDDDDKNEDAVDEREQSVVNGLVSNDEAQLGSLLQVWVEDFTAADVVSGILNKTFVADVGEAVDASQPMVRTMVMGTQEAADAYAVNALGSLGIDPQQPVGFSWTNAAIGSVSYGRGSGNELGVITVSVKQLPGLTKIRLVKDAEGNTNETAYYSKGDIVRYTVDNKYYICLNDHTVNNDATWISFDCGEEINSLPTGTCNWMGAGTDIVYKTQAKSEPLLWWIREYLFNDNGYNQVICHMANLPKTAVNQLVPCSQNLRNILMQKLIHGNDDVVLDVNSTINGETDLRASKYFSYADQNVKANKVIRTFTPLGLLLADNMRWSMGFTYDYWVPYIVLTEMKNGASFLSFLGKVSSQFEDTSHFKYQGCSSFGYNDKYYFPFVVAVHWTHKDFVKDGVTYKNIIDFTQHKRKLEGKAIDLSKEADLDWTLRNITSRQLDVKDKGEKNSKFETIYRGKGNE